MRKFSLKSVRCFAHDQSGVVAIEYTLIAGAMGIALVAAMPILAPAVKGKLISVGGYFSAF